MQLDLTVVPRLAERQAVGALVDAREAINQQRNEICKELYAMVQKRMAQFREEIAPLRAQIEQAGERLETDMAAIDDQIAELSRPFLERMDVIDNDLAEQHPDLLTSEDGDPKFCSVSGLALMEDDELWQSEAYGDALMVLFHPDEFSRDHDVANSAISPRPEGVAA